MKMSHALPAIFLGGCPIASPSLAIEVNENLIHCADTLNGKPTSCSIKEGTLTGRHDHEMTFTVKYTNTCYRGNAIRAGFVFSGNRYYLEREIGDKQIVLQGYGPVEFADFDPRWNKQIFVRKDCEIKVTVIEADLSWPSKALLDEKIRFLEHNVESLSAAK